MLLMRVEPFLQSKGDIGHSIMVDLYRFMVAVSRVEIYHERHARNAFDARVTKIACSSSALLPSESSLT